MQQLWTSCVLLLELFSVKTQISATCFCAAGRTFVMIGYRGNGDDVVCMLEQLIEF